MCLVSTIKSKTNENKICRMFCRYAYSATCCKKNSKSAQSMFTAHKATDNVVLVSYSTLLLSMF